MLIYARNVTRSRIAGSEGNPVDHCSPCQTVAANNVECAGGEDGVPAKR